MGRRGYPAEFRRRVLGLVAAGRSVVSIATDLGISEQTIYTWRRQERIDKGLEPGISSREYVISHDHDPPAPAVFSRP